MYINLANKNANDRLKISIYLYQIGVYFVSFTLEHPVYTIYQSCAYLMKAITKPNQVQLSLQGVPKKCLIQNPCSD